MEEYGEFFKSILGQLQELNNGQKMIVGRIDKLEVRMDSLEAGQKELYQLYSSLEEHTKVTRNMVVNLAEDVNQLKGSVTKLETGQARLENTINEVEQRLEAKIDSVEQRLDAKINGVEQSLNAKIGGVEQRLDESIKSQTDYILQKIIEHDMEIYNLKKKVG